MQCADRRTHHHHPSHPPRRGVTLTRCCVVHTVACGVCVVARCPTRALVDRRLSRESLLPFTDRTFSVEAALKSSRPPLRTKEVEFGRDNFYTRPQLGTYLPFGVSSDHPSPLVRPGQPFQHFSASWIPLSASLTTCTSVYEVQPSITDNLTPVVVTQLIGVTERTRAGHQANLLPP